MPRPEGGPQATLTQLEAHVRVSDDWTLWIWRPSLAMVKQPQVVNRVGAWQEGPTTAGVRLLRAKRGPR
jgi:hypothetical protein